MNETFVTVGAGASALLSVVVSQAAASRFVPRFAGIKVFTLIAAIILLMFVTISIAVGSSLSRLIGVSFCYIFLCELYVFFVTLVASSISVSILLRLSMAPKSVSVLRQLARGTGMAAGRLEGLQCVGLIQHSAQYYALTPRGHMLAAAASTLRQFFFPNNALPAPGTVAGSTMSSSGSNSTAVA